MTTPMDSRVPGSSGPDEELTLSQIPILHTSKRAFSLLAHLGVVTQACKTCTMGFAQGTVSIVLSGTITCPLVQVLSLSYPQF